MNKDVLEIKRFVNTLLGEHVMNAYEHSRDFNRVEEDKEMAVVKVLKRVVLFVDDTLKESENE